MNGGKLLLDRTAALQRRDWMAMREGVNIAIGEVEIRVSRQRDILRIKEERTEKELGTETT